MTYDFSITLRGTGKNKDEAWEDAVTAFTVSPGYYDECQVEKIEDEEV